jgi:hypothetical protein
VRTPDGRIRTLGVEHVQIMLNAGLLTRDTCITDLANENWRPIEEHEIWPQLRHSPKPPSRTQPLTAGRAADQQGPDTRHVAREVTPEMAERMRQMRKRETDRLSRALWLHRLSRWTDRSRDACQFVLFLGLGDVLSESIANDMGTTKLGAMLAVLTLGTIYIAWRTFQH